jgi:hypothetical protein
MSVHVLRTIELQGLEPSKGTGVLRLEYWGVGALGCWGVGVLGCWVLERWGVGCVGALGRCEVAYWSTTNRPVAPIRWLMSTLPNVRDLA